MDVIDASTAEARLDLEAVPAAYRRFQEREGVPVHRGLAVDDWTALAVDEWGRTGQRGPSSTSTGTRASPTSRSTSSPHGGGLDGLPAGLAGDGHLDVLDPER